LGQEPGCSQFTARIVAPVLPQDTALPIIFETNTVREDEPPGEEFPRVIEISWQNDRPMKLSDFHDPGLIVQFSESMMPETANLSTFVVTIEIPDIILLNNDQRLYAGHRPFIVFGGVEIIGDDRWRFRPCPPLPPEVLRTWLEQERNGPLDMARQSECLNGTTFDDADFDLNPIRVRVTLKGNVILSKEGDRQLDGNVFGQPSGDGRTDLIFPSGDGIRGGDFESWFFFNQDSI
jgi:hypothetical protein